MTTDFFAIYPTIPIMRFYLFFPLSCLCLATVIFSCKGPEGPAGANGNADVLQLNYGSQEQQGTTDLFVPLPESISPEAIESGLIYIYVKQTITVSGGTALAYWFPIPGETTTGNEYSYYVFPGSSGFSAGVYIRRVVNYLPGTEHFEAVRMLIIPAGSVTNARLAGPEAYIKDYPVWNADIKKRLPE